VAIFSYRATTSDGAIVESVIEASDEKAAVDRLQDSGLIPLKISKPREGMRKKFFSRSPKADVLTFTTELSALLGAGLPLDRSLNILSEISEKKKMNSIIKSVLKSIRAGNSFSDSLQKHPVVFSKLYVSMIRAGESGGVLDIVLDKLNDFLESAMELRENVLSAMIYPAILFLTGVSSIIILLTYVLPKFSTIFTEMDTPLPFPTQVLIAFSSAITSYWWIIILLGTTVLLAFRNYIKSDVGRYKWDAFKLKIIGDIIRKLETARFTRTLGTLLKSGVPLLQALNNSKDVINNRVMASAIDNVSKGAKEGKGIAGPLSHANVFPVLALSMIKVGEETGQLDLHTKKA
jgi:general secretion pathway protein F